MWESLVEKDILNEIHGILKSEFADELECMRSKQYVVSIENSMLMGRNKIDELEDGYTKLYFTIRNDPD